MKVEFYKLSDQAVYFIKTYALVELKLKLPIDADTFETIFEYAVNCELDMVDDNGEDKPIEIAEERDYLGDKFVTEVSPYDDIDLDDLNSRLISK